eukprot:366372-Chlamydomonas_euryale.AAC.14
MPAPTTTKGRETPMWAGSGLAFPDSACGPHESLDDALKGGGLQGRKEAPGPMGAAGPLQDQWEGGGMAISLS